MTGANASKSLGVLLKSCQWRYFSGDKVETKKVRYAVVGLGWIAPETVTPASKHANNSAVTALVTDDPVKGEELRRKYQVPQTIGYSGYDGLLRSGFIEAVYIPGRPVLMRKLNAFRRAF